MAAILTENKQYDTIKLFIYTKQEGHREESEAHGPGCRITICQQSPFPSVNENEVDAECMKADYDEKSFVMPSYNRNDLFFYITCLRC